MEFHVVVPPPGAGGGSSSRAAMEESGEGALGFAAAELALIAITLNPETSRFMGACAPTDPEAADLRAGAELLLLASAAQVLASTVAVLAPARPCALAATALAALTAYRASAVLLMLASHVHGAHAFGFGLVLGTLFVAFLVAVVVSVS